MDDEFLLAEDIEETASPAWIYQRSKLDQFQNQIESSFTAMQTSFDYLMKTINKNPERIIFDVENIIVLGNLATYTIPVKSVLSKLKNPFVGGGGLQATRTTRKGELKGKETNVCIQPDTRTCLSCPVAMFLIRIF